MKRIIAATHNKGKIREIKDILKDLPLDVVPMKEAGYDLDIEETGTTFEENALIKARAVSKASGEIAVADDSGLEVDFLNGAPGVYSARYAGEGASDFDRIRKLLSELEGVPADKRTGRFVSAVAVVFPDGREFVVKGTVEGVICEKPEGQNGFGYDPIFYVPEFKMTMAQMSIEQKNQISHRAKAFAKMAAVLKEMIGEI